MESILITGANGFIGNSIAMRLAISNKHKVRVAIRKKHVAFPRTIEVHDGLDISQFTNWAQTLEGIDTIIHCAARVHFTRDFSKNTLSDFRKVNTEGTLALARQAELHGVKRFVFLSSLGVNGEESFDLPFKADDTPRPHSLYTQSKLESEIGLMEISQSRKLSVVIVRPPLVYGPNAPGNFGRLMKLVNNRIPLPFGLVKNKRSFVFLDNLVDMIGFCLINPNAANQIFLVSDDEDMSTALLAKKIGKALGKPALLLPIPASILKRSASILGQSKPARQLLGSLQADIEKTKSLLGWNPPFSVDEALKKMSTIQ